MDFIVTGQLLLLHVLELQVHRTYSIFNRNRLFQCAVNGTNKQAEGKEDTFDLESGQ